jgi:hypothetical protein
VIAMNLEELQSALQAAGWSIGDTAINPDAGMEWHVYAHKGETKLLAKGASQIEAWREIVRMANEVDR